MSCKYKRLKWVCLKMSCTQKKTMVLLIIIPFLNGFFIGNSNPTFSDKPKYLIGASCKLLTELTRQAADK